MIMLCVLLWPSAAFAERVQMKSGEVYSGEIVDRNDTFLTLKSGGAPMYLPVDEIANVGKEISAPFSSILTPGEIPQGASIDYVCKNGKCAFKIPEGFLIVEETETSIVMTNADKTFEIKVMPWKMDKPITDENIGDLGLQMTAVSLKVDIADGVEALNEIVKMFGERKVSGRKAMWFYYPEINKEYLMHRTYVSTPEGRGFMIELDVYPQQNDHYLEDGEIMINAFLDGFEIRKDRQIQGNKFLDEALGVTR